MKEKHQKFNWPVLTILVFGIVLGGFGFTSGKAMAASPAVPDIKIAVVYPLSGALSRNGNLQIQGIKAAMGWVNDNGGIKSLGGAKLVPVIADGGSTVEGSASAMDRVCRDPEIVMALGCWASSFTFAATEITERLGIPTLADGFSDALHERGFKWSFYETPPSTAFGDLGVRREISVAEAAGAKPKTAMLIYDNNAAARAHAEAVKKTFANMGIKVLGEEEYTVGTLTDATPIIQKVKSANPDIVIFGPSSIQEAQLLLMKKRELRVNMPFLGATGAHADPSFREIGAENLEGFSTISPAFPHKLTPPDWIKRTLEQCRKEYSDERFMGQELTYGWCQVPIMAEILERAGSRDHKAIREAASKLDIHNVMATRATAGQGMAFDEKNRIVKKYQNILVVQWQGGVAYTVYPPELATRKPIKVGKE